MPANDRLRAAIYAAGLSPDDVASRLAVDPKTVGRWVTQGRAPYPRYRARLAALVHESESYLWPDVLDDSQRGDAAMSEIVRAYPHRTAIERDAWARLFDRARGRIAILAYAALFLPEQFPGVMDTIERRVASGTDVRILLGDPSGSAVVRRSLEEGIGPDAVGAKVKNALALFQARGESGAIDVRTHDTTLYASIYWVDDEMFVNQHVYGLPAAQAPVLHLRRLPTGDLFTTFANAFERVWATAKPAEREAPAA